MYSENKPTVITLDHGNQKVTVELPWDAGMDDILNAFYGMCVCATFAPKTVLLGMKEFVNERDYEFESCGNDNE